MKISILFVSPSREVFEFVSKHRARIIPQNLRQSGDAINVVPFLFTNMSGLIERVLNLVPHSDAIGLVIDDALTGDFSQYSDAVFLGKVTVSSSIEMLGNSISRFFSVWMKNFFLVVDKFKERNAQKILLLPEKQFSHMGMGKMFSAFSELASSRGFCETLELALSELRKTYRPTRAQKSPQRFLIDDKGLCFAFCDEKHSQAEEGEPHNRHCVLRKYFRFGTSICIYQHYNVKSQDDKLLVSGRYFDCHAADRSYTQRTHLNVFPSGYVEI